MRGLSRNRLPRRMPQHQQSVPSTMRMGRGLIAMPVSDKVAAIRISTPDDANIHLPSRDDHQQLTHAQGSSRRAAGVA
jgi:hypothetical protein